MRRNDAFKWFAPCSRCDKRLRSKPHWSCAGKGRFVWKQCEWKFDYKTVTLAHVIIHTSEKQHPCSECGKCFRWIGYLRRPSHGRWHRVERHFSCSHCNKKCARACTTGATPHPHRQWPFACDLCYRTFRLLCAGTCRTIWFHRFKHAGEKPHNCGKCGKIDVRWSKLSNNYFVSLTHPY